MVPHSCKHNSLPVATKHGPAMSPAVPGESQSQHIYPPNLAIMLCSPLSALQHVSLMKEKGVSFSQSQTTNAAGVRMKLGYNVMVFLITIQEERNAGETERRPFNRETDLDLPKNLVTPAKRQALMKDSAKSLASKFTHGKQSFL